VEVPPGWLSIYRLSSASAFTLPFVILLFVFGSQIVGNTVSTTKTAGLCQNYDSSFLARTGNQSQPDRCSPSQFTPVRRGNFSGKTAPTSGKLTGLRKPSVSTFGK